MSFCKDFGSLVTIGYLTAGYHIRIRKHRILQISRIKIRMGGKYRIFPGIVARRLEIASDNVYSIFQKTNEMKSDLAWKREWEANVREKARQEQARQEQRARQPKRKKRSYDMSL